MSLRLRLIRKTFAIRLGAPMKETILLLASEPVIRRAIGEALEARGYCVLQAGAIDQAVDFLKSYNPDLLMVRHYTQSMPGHDAAVYLRKIRPGLPVLVVGGLLNDSGLADRAAVHEFEIFPKPYNADELVDKVRELLARNPTIAVKV